MYNYIILPLDSARYLHLESQDDIVVKKFDKDLKDPV